MRVTALLTLLALTAGAQAAAPPALHLEPDGPAQPLLSPQQRQAIGLRNGPDSIVDLWKDGAQTYLVFSGATEAATGVEGGQTFRLAVDPSVTRISGPLQPILHAVCRAGDRTDAARTCNRFDSDYAGAGTIVQCPNATLYIYHGENHTAPDGHFAGGAGWTGIGQAHWDAGRRMLVSDGQIAGLNVGHDWGSTPDSAPRTAPASGNPSVVPDPTGTYLYMYSADRSESAQRAGRDLPCAKRTCWSVARVARADFCAAAAKGRPASWQKLHLGHFDQPALLPGATGGLFTPILDDTDGVDNLANVTAIPSQHLYVMASILRPGDRIVERVSTDGLAWSAPIPLVDKPDSTLKLTYPRIVQGANGFVLTYMSIVKHTHWQNATLMRLKLRMTGG